MKTYEDNRNLITSISNSVISVPSVVSTFSYNNDAIGRRTQRIDNNTATNTFGYNTKSELINAVMGANTFGYDYDPIGNRLSSVSSVPSVVTNLYQSNELNQYTNITDSRQPTAYQPTFDLDGNMLSEVRIQNSVVSTNHYTWNGENRLIMASNANTIVTYAYDYMGRRFSKIVKTNSVTTTNLFVYDGWNLIAEKSVQSATSADNYYVWGLDLSGSLQGAGGIGGLLSVIDCSVGSTNQYFPVYDANGNITEYITTNGTIAAHYEYDPFGNIIASSGTKADKFHFRFSSKYLDKETGLYYYGYRYYSPTFGRWINRDPLSEQYHIFAYLKGKSSSERRLLLPKLQTLPAYRFLGNRPVDQIDPLGLINWKEKKCIVCGVKQKGKLPQAWYLSELAKSVAAAKYPPIPPSTVEPPEANAYRHCLWACGLTKLLGDADTKVIQDCHEKHAGGAASDTATDEFNNAIGNAFGKDTSKTCAEHCNGAMPPNGPPTLQL